MWLRCYQFIFVDLDIENLLSIVDLDIENLLSIIIIRYEYILVDSYLYIFFLSSFYHHSFNSKGIAYSHYQALDTICLDGLNFGFKRSSTWANIKLERSAK